MLMASNQFLTARNRLTRHSKRFVLNYGDGPWRRKVARGLYRDGDWVRVEYEGKAPLSVPRDLYAEKGYKPSFEKLPTKAEYYERQNSKPS
jgi:hypothetical protein